MILLENYNITILLFFISVKLSIECTNLKESYNNNTPLSVIQVFIKFKYFNSLYYSF